MCIVWLTCFIYLFIRSSKYEAHFIRITKSSLQWSQWSFMYIMKPRWNKMLWQVCHIWEHQYDILFESLFCEQNIYILMQRWRISYAIGGHDLPYFVRTISRIMLWTLYGLMLWCLDVWQILRHVNCKISNARTVWQNDGKIRQNYHQTVCNMILHQVKNVCLESCYTLIGHR